MITGRQIRAARGLLRWRVADLAEKTGLTREAITRMEDDSSQPRESSVAKLIEAFEKEDIEFIGQAGVRRRDDRVREIDGPDCYARLLDEVYYQLEKGDEFLIAWADETISPPAVHAAMKRIVQKGIKYRKFIQQGNTFICGPLSWYRYIPQNYYQNATAVFFQDKSAYLTEDFKTVVVLRDAALAKANKNFFEIIWSSSTSPAETTSNEKYS